MLTWTDNANDPNEDSFVIERAVGAGAFTLLDSVGADVTTYTDANVVSGNNYSYRVAAANTAGQSGYSNTVSVTLSLAPAAPANLTATVLFGPKVVLNWTDASSNETSFRIERADVLDGVVGAFSFLASVSANVTTFTDLTVVSGSDYSYRVAAVNTVDQSAYADSVPAVVSVVLDLVGAPTGLTATAQDVPQPQVLLEWTDNADNETGFVIERADGLIGGTFSFLASVPAAVDPAPVIVSYTDTTVVPGNTYRYRVAAVTTGGQSAYSNEAAVTVPIAPGVLPAAPESVLATVKAQGRDKAKVTLDWTDAANNETGYRIQRATNDTFTAGLAIIDANANTTSYVDRNLARTTAYYYRIAAFNLSGESAWVNAAPFPIITP